VSQEHNEDELLHETLRRQKELMDYYKDAAKQSPEDRCKQMYKHLQGVLKEQVGDVASELARHRMERELGRSIDRK